VRRVEQAVGVLLQAEDRRADRGFVGALASLPRRQILSFLSQTALTTAELAGRFGMSAPAISRHLGILQDAGLVSGERQGQRVLYRLNRDALLNALSRLAAEVDGPLRTAPREAI
jgi:DNA-binding transcriptional ArsR family regulator